MLKCSKALKHAENNLCVLKWLERGPFKEFQMVNGQTGLKVGEALRSTARIQCDKDD